MKISETRGIIRKSHTGIDCEPSLEIEGDVSEMNDYVPHLKKRGSNIACPHMAKYNPDHDKWREYVGGGEYHWIFRCRWCGHVWIAETDNLKELRKSLKIGKVDKKDGVWITALEAGRVKVDEDRGVWYSGEPDELDNFLDPGAIWDKPYLHDLINVEDNGIPSEPINPHSAVWHLMAGYRWYEK